MYASTVNFTKGASEKKQLDGYVLMAYERAHDVHMYIHVYAASFALLKGYTCAWHTYYVRKMTLNFILSIQIVAS